MFACRAVCAPRDPASDTVKIEMDTRALEAQQQEADRQAQGKEAEEARQLAQESEMRAAEEARIAEEQAAQRRADEERLRQQAEEAKREEKARRERQAEEEEARRKLEQEILERKEAIAAFLKEHKFKGTTAAKKSMMSTTYAIHTAAMRGDEKMVKMLIDDGADAEQKNSAGKTAAQLAQKKNSQGSHAGVLRVLGGA